MESRPPRFVTKIGLILPFAALAAFLGFAGGFWTGRSSAGPAAPPEPPPSRLTPAIRQRSAGYSFINPLLLGRDYSDPHEFSQYRPLEDKLVAFINAQIKQGRVEKMSVYFRDLNGGLWTGVNDQDSYSAASLFKIPIMIALFKEAERTPSILQNEVTVTAADLKDEDAQVIPPSHTVSAGKTYSIDDLIRRMIAYSDNSAMNALLRYIDLRAYDEILSDLGIDKPDGAPGHYKISPKKFALLFRVLYNATYLNHDMSEKALALLSESDFGDGVVAGVPLTVNVAHKFGEVAFMTGGEYGVSGHELHDCGIVYLPGRPYLLCVMTHGLILSDLERSIADMSALVYATMSKETKAP